MSRLDHLVVTAPSLEAGVEALEGRLGVRPSAGGSHRGWGTCNALLLRLATWVARAADLDLELDVAAGPEAALIATLESPRGVVTLP